MVKKLVAIELTVSLLVGLPTGVYAEMSENGSFQSSVSIDENENLDSQTELQDGVENIEGFISEEALEEDGDNSFEVNNSADNEWTDTTESTVETNSTVSDFEYSTDDVSGTAQIKKYIGSDSVVEIPQQINGYTVTSVDGFYANGIITKVIVPNGVKEIRQECFEKCENLKNVVLADSVETIGFWAFKDCESLSNIELSASLQTIDEGAFLNTVGLKEITIPDGVKTISRFAFEGSGIEKINLPENLEVIGYGAFKSTNLKEVVIPENVNIDEAGQEAGFNNCEQLERVEFKGKTSLQYYEFEGCDNLKEIIFRQGNNIIDARYITSKATIYGLSNSSAYNFANKNGNSFCSIDPPQNRKAEKVDNTTIKLSWTAVSKNASYKVYRSTSENSGYSLIATVEATNYTDYNLPEDTKYYYKICTWYENIEGVLSSPVEGDLTRVDVGSLTITEIPIQDYTGEEICPSIEIKNGDEILEESRDYTIKYENNINVGTATIIISGINDYKGERKLVFIITAKTDISNGNIESIGNQYYTGNMIKPTVKVMYGNSVLVENQDYTLRYSNNVQIGIAEIVVTGINYYKGEKRVQFQIIDRMDIEKAYVPEISKQFYTGYEIKPEFAVLYGNSILKENEDYTLTYLNNTSIGTAEIVISGINSYKGGKRIRFQIVDKKDIAKASISEVLNQYYTGQGICPKVILTYENEVLKENVDYTLEYSNNINPGKATIKIQGINECKGSVLVDFNIFQLEQPIMSNVELVNKNAKIEWTSTEYAQGYCLMRKSGNGSWQKIAELSDNQYVDKAVSFGKTYSYTVMAYTIANGETHYSSYDDKGMSIAITYPASTWITAKPRGYNTIKVTWRKVPGITGYCVYRKTSENGTYKCIATLKNVLSYTDKKAVGGNTYYYKVKAYKKIGSKKIMGNEGYVSTFARANRQPKLVSLKTGKTYTKYDVTGDGRNDKVSLKYSASGRKNTLTIYVNGKKAGTVTANSFDEFKGKYEIYLCSVNTKAVFLSVRFESNTNDNQILHQLYRYKKGKFKSALNVHKALKIKGMQSSSIEQVYSDGIGFYANNLGKRVLWLYGLKNNKLKLKTKRSIR